MVWCGPNMKREARGLNQTHCRRRRRGRGRRRRVERRKKGRRRGGGGVERGDFSGGCCCCCCCKESSSEERIRMNSRGKVKSSRSGSCGKNSRRKKSPLILEEEDDDDESSCEEEDDDDNEKNFKKKSKRNLVLDLDADSDVNSGLQVGSQKESYHHMKDAITKSKTWEETVRDCCQLNCGPTKEEVQSKEIRGREKSKICKLIDKNRGFLRFKKLRNTCYLLKKEIYSYSSFNSSRLKSYANSGLNLELLEAESSEKSQQQSFTLFPIQSDSSIDNNSNSNNNNRNDLIPRIVAQISLPFSERQIIDDLLKRELNLHPSWHERESILDFYCTKLCQNLASLSSNWHELRRFERKTLKSCMFFEENQEILCQDYLNLISSAAGIRSKRARVDLELGRDEKYAKLASDTSSSSESCLPTAITLVGHQEQFDLGAQLAASCPCLYLHARLCLIIKHSRSTHLTQCCATNKARETERGREREREIERKKERAMALKMEKLRVEFCAALPQFSLKDINIYVYSLSSSNEKSNLMVKSGLIRSRSRRQRKECCQKVVRMEIKRERKSSSQDRRLTFKNAGFGRGCTHYNYLVCLLPGQKVSEAVVFILQTRGLQHKPLLDERIGTCCYATASESAGTRAGKRRPPPRFISTMIDASCDVIHLNWLNLYSASSNSFTRCSSLHCTVRFCRSFLLIQLFFFFSLLLFYWIRRRRRKRRILRGQKQWKRGGSFKLPDVNHLFLFTSQLIGQIWSNKSSFGKELGSVTKYKQPRRRRRKREAAKGGCPRQATDIIEAGKPEQVSSRLEANLELLLLTYLLLEAPQQQQLGKQHLVEQFHRPAKEFANWLQTPSSVVNYDLSCKLKCGRQQQEQQYKASEMEDGKQEQVASGGANYSGSYRFCCCSHSRSSNNSASASASASATINQVSEETAATCEASSNDGNEDERGRENRSLNYICESKRLELCERGTKFKTNEGNIKINNHNISRYENFTKIISPQVAKQNCGSICALTLAQQQFQSKLKSERLSLAKQERDELVSGASRSAGCYCCRNKSITTCRCGCSCWPAQKSRDNNKKSADECSDNSRNNAANDQGKLVEVSDVNEAKSLLAGRSQINSTPTCWKRPRKTLSVSTKRQKASEKRRRSAGKGNNGLSKLLALFFLLILCHLLPENDDFSRQLPNWNNNNIKLGVGSKKSLFKFQFFVFQPVTCSSSLGTLKFSLKNIGGDNLETGLETSYDRIANNLRNRQNSELDSSSELLIEEYDTGTNNDELNLARTKKANSSILKSQLQNSTSTSTDFATFTRILTSQDKLERRESVGRNRAPITSEDANDRDGDGEEDEDEDQDQEEDRNKQQPKYRWPFIGLVGFMFIGATGNILVCMAIWRERRLQTATNYFLLSLAVADLLVCTLVMPFGIIYEFYGLWPFDWRICNLWVTCDVLTCSSSILHMCFISVGRYLGIRNPLHARQANLFVSRRAVLWRIALAWFSAAIIASPITMMSLYDHKNIVPNPTECAISNKYFLIFGSMLAFFIPMFAMVPSYIMTVRLLSRRAKFVQNNSLLLTNPSIGGGSTTTSVNHHNHHHQASDKPPSSLESSSEIKLARQQLRDDNLTCADTNTHPIVGSSSLPSRDINHNKTTVILRHQPQDGQVMDGQKVACPRREGSLKESISSCKKDADIEQNSYIDKEQQLSTMVLDKNVHKSRYIDQQRCTSKNVERCDQNTKLAANMNSGSSKSHDCMTCSISTIPSPHLAIHAIGVKKSHHSRSCHCSISCNRLKNSTSCNLTTLAKREFAGSDKIKSSTDLTTSDERRNTKLSPQQDRRQFARVKTRSRCHKRCCKCPCTLKSSNIDLFNGELRDTKYIDEDACSISSHTNRCQSTNSTQLGTPSNSPKRIKCSDKSSCSECNQEEKDRTALRVNLNESSVLDSEHCHRIVAPNSNYYCNRCYTLNTNFTAPNLKQKSTHVQQQQNKLESVPINKTKSESLEKPLYSNEICLSKELYCSNKLELSTMIESDPDTFIKHQQENQKFESNVSHLGGANSLLSVVGKCNSINSVGKAGSLTDKMRVVVIENEINRISKERDDSQRENVNQTLAQKTTSQFNHPIGDRRSNNELTNVIRGLSDSSSMACCSLEQKKEGQAEQTIEALELLRRRQASALEEKRQTNVIGHYKSLEIVGEKQNASSPRAQNCDLKFECSSSEREIINNKLEITTRKTTTTTTAQNDQLQQLHLSSEQQQAKFQKSDSNGSSVIVLPPIFKNVHLDDSLKSPQIGRVDVTSDDERGQIDSTSRTQVRIHGTFCKGSSNFLTNDLTTSNNCRAIEEFKEKGQTKLTPEKIKACSIDSICTRRESPLTNTHHNHNNNHRNCVREPSLSHGQEQNTNLDQNSSQRHKLQCRHHHHNHHHHHGHRHNHRRHQSHKRGIHCCASRDNKTRDLEIGSVNSDAHREQQEQASQSSKRSHHKQNCSTNHHYSHHPHHPHHHHHHHRHHHHHLHRHKPSTKYNSTAETIIEMNHQQPDKQKERIPNATSNVSITLRRASDQGQQKEQQDSFDSERNIQEQSPKSSSAASGKCRAEIDSREGDINTHHADELKTSHQEHKSPRDIDKNNNNNDSVSQNGANGDSMISNQSRNKKEKKCSCVEASSAIGPKSTTSSKSSSIYHPFCSCYGNKNNYITVDDESEGSPFSMSHQVVIRGCYKSKGGEHSTIKNLHLSSSALPKMLGDDNDDGFGEKELEECGLEGLKSHTTSVVSSSLIIAAIPVLPPALASNQLLEVEQQQDIKRPVNGINVNSTTTNHHLYSSGQGNGDGRRIKDSDDSGASMDPVGNVCLQTAERGHDARGIVSENRVCNINNGNEQNVSKGLNLSKNDSNSAGISVPTATTATTTTTATLTTSAVTLISSITADTKLQAAAQNEAPSKQLPLATSTQLNYVSVENNEPPQMIRYLGSSMQVRSEQKATKVLGVVFFTFVICWTPFFVINFAQAFVERDELAKWISNEIMTTFLWLGYISSTINPVIYTVFNRNFRRAFRQLLLCRRANHGYKLRSRNFELNRSFRMSQYGRHPGNGFNSSMYSAASRQNFNTKSGFIGPQANHQNVFGDSLRITHANKNNNNNTARTDSSGTRDAMIMLDENQVSRHSHQRSSSTRSSNTKGSNEQSLAEEGLEQQAVVNNDQTTFDNQRDHQKRGMAKKLTKQSTLSYPTHQVRGAIRQALKSSSSLFSSFSTSLKSRDDSTQDGRYKISSAGGEELSSSDTRNKDEAVKLIPSDEAVRSGERSKKQSSVGCAKPDVSDNIQRAGIMRSSQQSSVKSTMSQNLQTTRPKLSFLDQTKG